MYFFYFSNFVKLVLFEEGRYVRLSGMVTTITPLVNKIKHCRHRTFGSAALNMAYLACGRLDLYFDYGIHCWDIAAGTLIVREAGGTVRDTTG